jgi:hypothetical protein
MFRSDTLMLHLHKITQLFLWEPSEKKLWVRRGFLWVQLWEMKFLNILVLAIKKVVRIMGSHNARNTNVMGL